MEILNPDFMMTFGFDPRSLIGLTGAPFVETAVGYLSDQWRLSKKAAPLAAMIIALALNIWMGHLLQMDFVSTIYSGLLTGFVSSGWYEVTKEPKISPELVQLIMTMQPKDKSKDASKQ